MSGILTWVHTPEASEDKAKEKVQGQASDGNGPGAEERPKRMKKPNTRYLGPTWVAA